MEAGMNGGLATFALPQPVKDVLLLLALVVSILAFVVAWNNYRAGVDRDQIAKREKTLADPASHDRLRADLSQPGARDAWRAQIDRLIAALERWFGPPWSWRAFDTSLRIAIVYPILLFALAWVAGANGEVGGIRFLPDGLPLWRRAAIFCVAVGSAVFLAWWLRNGKNLSRAASAGLMQRLADTLPRDPTHASALLLEWIAVAVAVAFAFAFAVAVAVAGAFAFAGAFAVAFAFAFAGAGAGAVAVAVAVAVAGAGAVAVTDAVVVAGADSIIYSTFFVILPLANTAFDFVSWFATRKLLDRMARDRTGWRGAGWIMTEIVLDLTLAALCLAGLAISMAFMLEAMNAYFAWRGAPIFDWRGYIEAARARPAYDPSNWMTLGMLASTIAPTALHLAAGLSGVVVSFFPNAANLAARIRSGLSEIEKQELAADIHRFQSRRRLLAAIFAPLILIALLWLLWASVGQWLPSLYDLADRAAALWRR